ncbi:dicarboxylate/amino acid:cation symporter [Novosphingobium sp. 1949]|uniref:Dicarboxylate/amino acid:cation symporter n=1 Tax=Novosphingobium organovorum TaxID=2930092 RepID=A0ABT0BCH8_9SPHN|nr:dicarboxylate/amino acid:cation symporter [Novosphingobium organovorum]MCJ2182758.1 dicarboxylate/amino acid:cation symporter [Novosphingobium organovorum]
MNGKMTRNVLISIILAIAVGIAARALLGADTPQAAKAAELLHLPADIFLHLIKMIVAPLVFSTLVYGIAHAGDSSGLGRIGLRAMTWFLTASLISLSIGLVMVNLFKPGLGLNLQLHNTASGIDPNALSFSGFVLHVFPISMTDAMARNEILQIVVFSLFLGFGLCAIGEKGKPIVIFVEAMVALMLKVTGYVMAIAPLAVFAALSSAMIEHGVGILATFAKLLGEYFLSLGLLWVILLLAGARFLGGRIKELLRAMREPLLIAFSTASSEAALPKLMEQLDRFGVPRRVYSFVLPLGYSFNLDGSMMSATFTTLFICQAYGITVPLGTQIIMLLTLMVTSKGIAGVPRASLVVVAATLSQFGLPVEGVAFVLAIDQFMDMGRTATNILGNGIATAAIGTLEDARSAALEDGKGTDEGQTEPATALG